jgi:RNA polymerase sigma-70 factor, ECF subfamily
MTEQNETDAADEVFKQQLVAIIPSLRAFARGLCRHRELADDIAQEAMTRAWAARTSFEPGTNFRAWMFMIARNQFYSSMRKSSRMVAWDPQAAERTLVQKPTQELSIFVHDVDAALAHLPPQQREILLLVTAAGLSYEDAAVAAGCTLGTVKSRLARARVSLHKLIEGTESEHEGDAGTG